MKLIYASLDESALSQSHFLIDIHEKWHGSKSHASQNKFFGLTSGHPFHYYGPKTATKEVRIGISSQIAKDVDFSSLSRFKRSIAQVDFLQFLKCNVI